MQIQHIESVCEHCGCFRTALKRVMLGYAGVSGSPTNRHESPLQEITKDLKLHLRHACGADNPPETDSLIVEAPAVVFTSPATPVLWATSNIRNSLIYSTIIFLANATNSRQLYCILDNIFVTIMLFGNRWHLADDMNFRLSEKQYEFLHQITVSETATIAGFMYAAS